MSSYTVHTISDFNEAFNEHKGECLVFDPEKARNLEPKKGSGKSYDVTYLPIQFKDSAGTVHNYPKFSFSAVTCAKCKPPHGANPDQIKHVNVSFRKMTYEDMAGGGN